MNSQERDTVSAAAANLPAIEPNRRLAQLFAEHYRRVLIAAYRIAGNMADAEDVAQSVFLRLKGSDRLDVENAGSYLYRAAINGALDLIRRKKNMAAEPLEAAVDVASKEADASPERALANKDLARLLRHAIDELAPRAAEMFAL